MKKQFYFGMLTAFIALLTFMLPAEMGAQTANSLSGVPAKAKSVMSRPFVNKSDKVSHSQRVRTEGTVLPSSKANAKAPARLPAGNVKVTLQGADLYGDGSGFILMLDKDCEASKFDESAYNYENDGTLSSQLWNAFDYKIPQDAENSTLTDHFVLNNPVEITIPAGSYDLFCANPERNSRIWALSIFNPENNNFSNNRGLYPNFEFEEGKSYRFSAEIYNGSPACVVYVEDVPVYHLLTNIPENVSVWVNGGKLLPDNDGNYSILTGAEVSLVPDEDHDITDVLLDPISVPDNLNMQLQFMDAEGTVIGNYPLTLIDEDHAMYQAQVPNVAKGDYKFCFASADNSPVQYGFYYDEGGASPAPGLIPLYYGSPVDSQEKLTPVEYTKDSEGLSTLNIVITLDGIDPDTKQGAMCIVQDLGIDMSLFVQGEGHDGFLAADAANNDNTLVKMSGNFFTIQFKGLAANTDYEFLLTSIDKEFGFGDAFDDYCPVQGLEQPTFNPAVYVDDVTSQTNAIKFRTATNNAYSVFDVTIVLNLTEYDPETHQGATFLIEAIEQKPFDPTDSNVTWRIESAGHDYGFCPRDYETQTVDEDMLPVSEENLVFTKTYDHVFSGVTHSFNFYGSEGSQARFYPKEAIDVNSFEFDHEYDLVMVTNENEEYYNPEEHYINFLPTSKVDNGTLTVTVTLDFTNFNMETKEGAKYKITIDNDNEATAQERLEWLAPYYLRTDMLNNGQEPEVYETPEMTFVKTNDEGEVYEVVVTGITPGDYVAQLVGRNDNTNYPDKDPNPYIYYHFADGETEAPCGPGVTYNAVFNPNNDWIEFNVPGQNNELKKVTFRLDLTHFNYSLKSGAKFSYAVEDYAEVEPLPTLSSICVIGDAELVNGDEAFTPNEQNLMVEETETEGLYKITYKNVPGDNIYAFNFCWNGDMNLLFGTNSAEPANYPEIYDAVFDPEQSITFAVGGTANDLYDVTIGFDTRNLDLQTKQGAKFEIVVAVPSEPLTINKLTLAGPTNFVNSIYDVTKDGWQYTADVDDMNEWADNMYEIAYTGITAGTYDLSLLANADGEKPVTFYCNDENYNNLEPNEMYDGSPEGNGPFIIHVGSNNDPANTTYTVNINVDLNEYDEETGDGLKFNYVVTPELNRTEWNFNGTPFNAVDEAKLHADDFWVLDNDGRMNNADVITNGSMLTAQGRVLDWTKGLLFTGFGGNNLRLHPNTSLNLNGKNKQVSIPVKAGDRLDIVSKSASNAQRALSATNLEVIAGFTQSKEEIINTGIVQEDGYVVISTPDGGVNLKSIKITPANELGKYNCAVSGSFNNYNTELGPDNTMIHIGNGIYQFETTEKLEAGDHSFRINEYDADENVMIYPENPEEGIISLKKASYVRITYDSVTKRITIETVK